MHSLDSRQRVIYTDPKHLGALPFKGRRAQWSSYIVAIMIIMILSGNVIIVIRL